MPLEVTTFTQSIRLSNSPWFTSGGNLISRMFRTEITLPSNVAQLALGGDDGASGWPTTSGSLLEDPGDGGT